MPSLPDEFLDSLKDVHQGHDLGFLKELQQPETLHINADAKSLHKVLKLVQAINEASVRSGMDKWFSEGSPYHISELPKHEAFFAAGALYAERLFMAANRVGKSVCGSYEDACHGTGIYPSWWTGKRFDHPVDMWVVGPDAVTVRETLQKELLGALGEEGTGMIPAHLLGKATGKQGVVGAVDRIRIKHVSGGWSTISFKNYKQDLQAFMGASVHVVHLDEECPIEIWNECNIRTATTDGIMYATFTPLNGYSRMVVNFCKSADFLMGAKPLVAGDMDDEGDELVGQYKKKAVIQAGWDDAPWLTQEVKERLLSDTPEHLKEARSKGIPSMEGGSVFTTPLESVLAEPFAIPDTWPRMYGMDVGWNVTAAVWGALDPNTGTIFLYDEHYQGEQLPQHHAHAIKMRGEWIRGVIDPAAEGRSQSDGTQLMRSYKQLGLRLMPADNSLEAGLHRMNEGFSTGGIKVFTTLKNFQKEYMLYKRKLNGSIDPHCDDHALDCFSGDTEVLTKDGWKFWPEVSEEDLLATVNLETDALEYQEPTRLVKRRHSGDMVRIKNQSLDFLVTPNHRMVVYPRRKAGGLDVKLAKDLSIWDKLKATCTWEGEDFTPPIDVSQEDWAEFLGWFVSEGHTISTPRFPGHGYEVGISQTFKANPEKCHAIMELLSRFPMKWHYDGKKKFYCSSKELWTILRPLGKCHEKYVPQEIKNARPEIIEKFLRAAVDGDGWWQGSSWTYSSTSKKLADDIYELCIKTGYNASITEVDPKPYNIGGRVGTSTRKQYWVRRIMTPNPLLRDYKNNPSFSTEQYEGMVYCATVPNSTLLVRRNGRCIVAGNCARYIINNKHRMVTRAEGLGPSSISYKPTRYDV